MPTNHESLQQFTAEEHTRILEEMDKEFPTALRFNVKGDFLVPEGVTSVRVKDLGIEFLPGSGPIDCRVLVSRSGTDLESVETDLGRVERIFDAMSFVRLGRKIKAFPALYSAETRVLDFIDDNVIQRTIHVLDALDKIGSPMRATLERSLTWFRDSFQATSTFNHFAMLWNSLENLLLELGEDDKPTRAKRVEEAKRFIASKGNGLTLDDLEHLHTDIVQKSIRVRMTRGFQSLFAEDSRHPISICFDRDPPEMQLWGIRNDVNHANIVERDLKQRARVFSAGYDLFVVTWNSISKALALSSQLPWKR